MGKKKGRMHKYGVSKGKTFMGGIISPKAKFDIRKPYEKLAKEGRTNPVRRRK